MRTLAIAASIALITGAGVAGIIVGDTGAQIARDYTLPENARPQPNSGTSVMRHRARISEAPLLDEALPGELRPTQVPPLRTASIPRPVRGAPGVTIDMGAVFPEEHPTANHALRSRIVPPGQASRTPPRAAERIRPTVVSPTIARPRAARTQAAPVRVVNRTEPARTQGVPVRTQIVPATVAPQPQASAPSATPVRSNRNTAARQPSRSTRARTPVRTFVAPPPAAPAAHSGPIFVPPAPVADPAALDATRRTTMSQGETESPAPAAMAPAPATPAPAPAETPSALLANP